MRRSRLSKVNDYVTNRKRVYDFLLVRHSNFGKLVLSCTVSEILQVFCAPEWPHPYSTLILGCSRCTRWPMLGLARAEALSYSAVKLFSKNSNICDHDTWTSHTDGRTDRWTIYDRNTALCTKVHRAVKIGRLNNCMCTHRMAVLFCLKWPNGCQLEIMTLYQIFWLFQLMWRTILPNFIPIQFETTSLKLFWRGCHNKMSSDTRSVHDPKINQKQFREIMDECCV